MSESIPLGIDHGYAAMKTAHCAFDRGKLRRRVPVAFVVNNLEYFHCASSFISAGK